MQLPLNNDLAYLCSCQEGENKKFITTIKVDPALINGITIELGDKFLDLSVATQLKKLQALLADGL